MELKKRLSDEISLLAAIFVVIILAITFSFVSFSTSLNKVITEAQPAQNAMEHMIQDVYRDNIVLIDYLNAEDYETVTLLDQKIEDLDSTCIEITSTMQNLIREGKLSDQQIIDDYNKALTLHNEVEELRDEIIDAHKEEIITGEEQNDKKQELLESHSILLNQAITEFTQTVQEIEVNNEELKKRIFWQSKIYALIVTLLIITFIVLTIRKMKKLSNAVIDPIDNTIKATKKFVEGDFTSTIHPSEEFSEINELQKNINNVFKVIKEETKKDTTKKKKIDLQLLKKEYVQILELIKKNTENKVRTNITDLKKNLNVTHPTILDRLNYLEKRGFIETKKEGREKFIIIKSQF